jgi:hypothetical protein
MTMKWRVQDRGSAGGSIVIRPSMRRFLMFALVLVLLPLLSFVRIGATLRGDIQVAAVLFAFTLPLWALLAIIGLRNRLILGPQGVAQTVLLRTWRFDWSEVSDFQALRPGRAPLTVAFRYTAAPEQQRLLHRQNTRLALGYGALWPGWEVDPPRLAGLLNQARVQWLAQDPAAASPPTSP